MKIATWNVNSLRVRLPQVRQWLAASAPDILCLQETKLADEEFPLAEIEAAGYRAICEGERTYNGVAILSREPPSAISRKIAGLSDAQRRLIAASYGGARVLSVYVPNGQEVGSDKYAYKLQWLRRLAEYLRVECKRHPLLALAGDFNIAPQPRDVHDPQRWEGSVLFSEPERAAFGALLALGLVDVFRNFEQPAASFTWWDYRAGAFRRNHGLRIDHILCSPALSAACTACRIDRAPRGWERPSDHAPVIAEFRLP